MCASGSTSGLPGSSGGPGAGGCTRPADAGQATASCSGGHAPAAAGPLADTAGPVTARSVRTVDTGYLRSRPVGRTWTRWQAAADTTADRPAIALRNTAAVRAPAWGSSGPHPGGSTAAPARVGMSAVAAARITCVDAGGRHAVVSRTPVRAADRRRHRAWPSPPACHVCRTPAVRRAVVPEAADGQSADGSPLMVPARYNFLYSSSSGVLRAAAARPSSAADQVPGPPASAGSRPYGLAGRSGTRRPVKRLTGEDRPRASRAASWTPAPRRGPVDSAGRSEIAHGPSGIEDRKKVRLAMSHSTALSLNFFVSSLDTGRSACWVSTARPRWGHALRAPPSQRRTHGRGWPNRGFWPITRHALVSST
jgi:hypothetical protein